MCHAVKAEASAAGAFHFTVALAGAHADGMATVWGAGAPLHRGVVLNVGLKQEAIEPLAWLCLNTFGQGETALGSHHRKPST